MKDELISEVFQDGSIEYRKRHGAQWCVGVVLKHERGTAYDRMVRRLVANGEVPTANKKARPT